MSTERTNLLKEKQQEEQVENKKDISKLVRERTAEATKLRKTDSTIKQIQAQSGQ